MIVPGSGLRGQWETDQRTGLLLYRLDWSTILLAIQPFNFNVATKIQTTPLVNNQTDTSAMGAGPYFYRIGVQ